MGTNVGGTPPNTVFAGLEAEDDTGIVSTVTTGGTFVIVLHASLLIASVASKDASLTVDGTAGTITVPAGKLGKYLFSASGRALGANSATVKLRPALAGSAFAAGKGAKVSTRLVYPASALELSFSFHGILNVDAAGAVSLQVTSGTNSDTVTFTRLQWSLQYLES